MKGSRGTILKGILLYYAEDAKRNESYIDWYKQEAVSLGMEIELRLVEEICGQADGEVPGSLRYIVDSERPDFVINRTRRAEFAEILERNEIPVFNSSEVSRLGNDKWESYRFFQNRVPEMPMARTKMVSSDEELREILFSGDFQGLREEFPVLKSRHGHGGTEVALLCGDGACDARTLYERFAGKSCILQERIPTEIPTDIRVYIMGGEMYAAVRRTGQAGGFLSNYSRGGHAELYALGDSRRQLVEKILRVLVIDYAGIDFIEDSHGNWYLGEVEDMVGARMLCACSTLSPVRDYLIHIRHRLESR